MTDTSRALAEILWKIYLRADPALPWTQGSDLFWKDSALSERILREHLDDNNGAASRPVLEREAQINWLWSTLGMQSETQLWDITCGPGLYAVEFAKRGCIVTGIDFSPISIAYAQDLAIQEKVAAHCTFVEQDIRHMDYGSANFDAAILLYGQLAVFPPAEAQALLAKIAQALKPGGRLCIELLDQRYVDKEDSTWWYTDDGGLWGEGPFLHLGERVWHPEKEVAVERYHIIHLEGGELSHVQMTDQTYAAETMTAMLQQAGFEAVEVYAAWDNLPVGDAQEWLVYVAQK